MNYIVEFDTLKIICKHRNIKLLQKAMINCQAFDEVVIFNSIDDIVKIFSLREGKEILSELGSDHNEMIIESAAKSIMDQLTISSDGIPEYEESKKLRSYMQMDNEKLIPKVISKSDKKPKIKLDGKQFELTDKLPKPGTGYSILTNAIEDHLAPLSYEALISFFIRDYRGKNGKVANKSYANFHIVKALESNYLKVVE